MAPVKNKLAQNCPMHCLSSWAIIYMFTSYENDNAELFYPFDWNTPDFSSLHAALSLAYLGAPVGSETSLELANLLGLEPLQTEDYLYNYLRVLFTQQELSEKLNTNIQLANKV